jgi:hypothetical protein
MPQTLIALGAALLNIAPGLEDRESYEAWKRAPTTFGTECLQRML